MSETFFDNINKLYKKTSFFEVYGGSFVTMIIILITFFTFFSYYWMLSNRTDIKANWKQMKCHPGVIPFAGFINAPEGVDKSDYTKENFSGCVYNILKNVTKVFTAPITILYTVILSSFSTILISLNSIRISLSHQRFVFFSLSKILIDKLNSVLYPVIIVFNRIGSFFGKIKGMLRIIYNFVVTLFITVTSLTNTTLIFAMRIMLLVAVILNLLWTIGLLFFPITFPIAGIAAVGSVIYIAFTILFVIFGNSTKFMFKNIDVDMMQIMGIRKFNNLLG